MPEIQVWNYFDTPIDISPDVSQNSLKVEITGEGKPLPEYLEKRVDENWDEVTANSPNAKDNPILFLEQPLQEDSEEIIVSTNFRGFKYTHAFNRNKEFHNLTDDLRKYSLLSISTHCHIVSKDNKLLFGTKKNQFNQISGFSGFPNIDEDSIVREGKTFLDIYKTIVNRLRPEIDYLVDSIDSISAVGIVYVNTPGLRGIDSDYLVRLDETADKAQKRFVENAQFQKELYTVDFEPAKIREFVTEIHRKGNVMSRYALGCAFAVMHSHFGHEEADKLLTTIRQEANTTISTRNETNYFKK